MSVQIGVYVTNLLYIPMTIHPFHRIKEDYFFYGFSSRGVCRLAQGES